jgi:integrase
MTSFNIKYLKSFRDRHGRQRHYLRKPGCKGIALPGSPGSAEFMEAYYAGMEVPRPIGAGKSPPGSLSSIIAAYYESAEFRTLKPQTQANYRNILDRFRTTHGGKPARLLQARHLKAILDGMIDKPSAARNLLKRLRGVFSFAADRGLIAFDPTVGVKLPIVRTAGFRAWTDDDIERFRSHWPNGSRARLALELLLFTGQRRSDVVRMGRQHVREGAIHVTQKKTGTHLSIPIHPILGAELDRLPKTNLTFVMTAQGKPMSEAGFTQWFVECAQAAGLPERSGPHLGEC